MRSVAALFLAAGVALAVPAQEKKKEPATPHASSEIKIPPEEAKRENPVKPAPESLAEGKRLFLLDCAMCHGKEADGKGDLVEILKTKLPNLRDPAALKNRTDGELFYILKKGKGEMVGEEERMTATQLWHMVNYVRSLAKAEEAKPKEAKPD
jgi:mono/diheme cytochrome c family protein